MSDKRLLDELASARAQLAFADAARVRDEDELTALRARLAQAEAAQAVMAATIQLLRLGRGRKEAREIMANLPDSARRLLDVVEAANGLHLLKVSLKHFGPSSDGSIERDIASAEDRLFTALARIAANQTERSE